MDSLLALFAIIYCIRIVVCVFFQAEDGIRDLVRSRGLGDVYKRQHQGTQTLPPGTISVFADGGFAGESALARMKPRDTQVIEFGVDLDVELALETNASTDTTKLLTFVKGKLVEHFVRRHRPAYSLENRSGSGRDVFLRLGYVNNAKVEGADELAWDSSAQRASAEFKIGPRQQLSLINISEPTRPY